MLRDVTRTIAVGAASKFGKSTEAYARLKRLIIETELAPGRVVRENELALLLGMSRTPLREGLGLLLRERWMVEEARRLRITRVTMPDVRQMFGLRSLLETQGIGEAVGRIDGRAQLQELEELGWGATYDPNDKASISEFLRRNTEFHTRLVAISGDAWLTDALRSILEQLERVTHITLAHGAAVEPDEWVQEHRALLTAVLAGTVEEARALVTDQVSQTRRRVIQVLVATGAVEDTNPGEARGGVA